MKVCTKCAVEKPRSEFYGDGKGGLKGPCKECYRAKQRRYHEENRDSELERMRGYMRKNQQVRGDYFREHYRANREGHIAVVREWQARNEHLVLAYDYASRARRFGREPVIEPFTRGDVGNTYGDHCFYCEDGAFEQVDHYFPVSLGGHHTLANARPSCVSCNMRKHDTPGEEFMANKKTPPSRND